jgi:TctA family transporter
LACLWFSFIGGAIGFVVGVLPGLGGLATLALMLPFAYKIDEPISAFCFLLGMHAITGTTGDITSILFGIPGEGTAACFTFLNQLVKITFVRGTLLIPFLLMFVFLGSFAAHNNISDIIVTLIFGVFGYFMVLFEWPRPPFVLGLVLGRTIENYLWISSSAYGASWLMHPTVMVILLIILATLGYSVFQTKKTKKKDDQPHGYKGT